MQGLAIQASVVFELAGKTHTFGFTLAVGVSSN